MGGWAFKFNGILYAPGSQQKNNKAIAMPQA